MNHAEFFNKIRSATNSRREFMFIEKYKAAFLNPEGIVCKNATLTYNPFGIQDILTLVFYKHKFPSGMGDCMNFVKILTRLMFIKI